MRRIWLKSLLLKCSTSLGNTHSTDASDALTGTLRHLIKNEKCLTSDKSLMPWRKIFGHYGGNNVSVLRNMSPANTSTSLSWLVTSFFPPLTSFTSSPFHSHPSATPASLCGLTNSVQTRLCLSPIKSTLPSLIPLSDSDGWRLSPVYRLYIFLCPSA